MVYMLSKKKLAACPICFMRLSIFFFDMFEFFATKQMTSCTKFCSANLRLEKKKQKNKNCCCAIVSHLRISSLLYIMADEAQSSHEIDPSKLNPLSPEVISKQATINIGMYQHTNRGPCLPVNLERSLRRL